ncbi:protein TonB [Flavobacterium sp. CG_9.10]|uniref:energy transducer TonB n=1 Tax=Flavobacterium sp. CG_9.10 TaxID=2787729 RepID=UPI0018CA07FE|nr:energy transducer TonB [Flavobacterium sp. CG_9.10]MBG6110660.1 protein TonB [Flavobacterium sp. CG_9.10]
MSKLSIYETSWLNLVFEHRNKEYGAYKLRQESTKTSLFALFMGLLLLASALSIPLVINHFYPDNRITIPIPEFMTPIEIIEVAPNEIKKIDKPVLPEVKTPNTAIPIESNQLVDPIIVQASQASPEIIKNTQNTSTASAITDGTAVVGINPTSAARTGTENASAGDPGDTIVATVALDKLPEFPGGINKFYSYVGNNFEKPEIEGVNVIRVYVSFVIEKDGAMSDIQVKNDPGYGLGKEAIRVLKSLRTKWSPGMVGSKAVRTAYNLPITVQMN